MADSTDTTSQSSAADCLRKAVQFGDGAKARSVTVKFSTADGKVFTQSYPPDTAIGEIKSILAEVFAVTPESMTIMQGETPITDDTHLQEFDLGNYSILELGLFSTKLGQIISAEDAYKDFAIADVITVHVVDSDDEDGYRNVIVEIIDKSIVKPFIGGYVDKDSGIEYHHGYSQTGPAKPKVPPENKSHRDTQTYFLRNRLLDTNYAQATQMSHEDVWIPNVTDKILTSGPYETAEEWERRRAVEDNVRTIQRYYRATRMRRALKLLSAEYKKRVRLEDELEQYYIEREIARKKEEIAGKVFPRTRDDFCMLYAMVDRWKKAEIQRICNSTTGPAKITMFYMLLDKEIQMLRSIEAHRQRMKKEMKARKDYEFFRYIGNPIAWDNHYKDCWDKYKDLHIQMDTLETQKGNAYYKNFLSLTDENVDLEDQLQALLDIKLQLREHNCPVSNELLSLIQRACDLLVRGINSKHLDMLMNRIKILLMRHIKLPECSFGVTNRRSRVKEKMMQTDLYYCTRCKKLKPHSDFTTDSHTSALRVCGACSWDDRTMEPWFDLAPYRYMLKMIRHEEKMKQSPSSVIFSLQDRDMFYIVETIWHSHSAISEVGDVYSLRLCRWFKELPWAPWNCVLLSKAEAKLHLEVKRLVDVYDMHFMYRVFNKHQLARVHFRNAVRMDEYFQEIGEADTKWNEIRNFKEFVAVNSKTKVFLSCH